MKVVYHEGLIFGSAFLNRFHPFEFDRARVALALLKKALGPEFDSMLVSPKTPVTLQALEIVHDPDYLKSLHQNAVYAEVIEVGLLRFLPRSWVQRWFLQPALWSVAAALLAAREALAHRCAFLLGGGFHHAKRSRGEGFCLVNDVAFVLETLRADGTLVPEDEILYIDLDVHQGNGVSDYYGSDARVKILDVFNGRIYPVYGTLATGVDLASAVEPGCADECYLGTVESGLSKLQALSQTPRLIIYNAGSDIYSRDLLGGLSVSEKGVQKRDALVIEMAHRLGVPLLVLASGGYSKMSAKLLSEGVLSAHRIYHS